MSMHKQITSTQNPFIKELIKLQEKSRFRKKSGVFLVEGVREISLALKGGYTINTMLICPEIAAPNVLDFIHDQAIQIIELTKAVYKKVAYRDSTEGVIAVVKSKEFSLNKLTFKHKTPLILVAEAPEKPGNIGALLRTADAANLDAVIIANPKTDLYNPNIIRSSVGCLFTTKIATGSSDEIIQFLKEKDIAIYCTTLQNSNAYYKEDFTVASAIVVGTEAEGLSEIWRNNATKNIKIPMQGEIDSMNVSVAAAIVIFEAKRQRKFNT